MENAITFSDKLKLIEFIFKSDKFTNGPKVKEFEEAWNKWLGSKYSLFVSSGSTANSLLIAAVKELYGLKDGDKVLVPACTWMTNVAPIFQNKLEPIFCDVSLDDYCIELNDLDKIYENHPDIKMIFTTHLLGFSSNVNVFRKYFENSIILEDCCEAHGVLDENYNKAGSDSTGATFSFYYGHHMTTIEGGFVSTCDFELYNLMKMKRSHGLAREASPEKFEEFKKINPEIIPTFLFPTDGYNFRNNELSAVLGLEQLKRLDDCISLRNENFKKYIDIVSSKKDLFYMPKMCKKISSFALPFVCKDKNIYLKLINLFEKYKIEYRPLVAGNLLRQPFLKDYKFGYTKEFYNADLIHELGLYIGNSQFVNEKHLSILRSIMEEL